MECRYSNNENVFLKDPTFYLPLFHPLRKRRKLTNEINGIRWILHKIVFKPCFLMIIILYFPIVSTKNKKTSIYFLFHTIIWYYVRLIPHFGRILLDILPSPGVKPGYQHRQAYIFYYNIFKLQFKFPKVVFNYSNFRADVLKSIDM